MPTAKRKTRSVSVSVRANLDAVEIIETCARITGHTPHSLYCHAINTLARDLAQHPQWQQKLSAHERQVIARHLEDLPTQ